MLQPLKSKRRKPIAFRRLELTPSNTSNQPARILNGRREFTLNGLRRPFLPKEVVSY